MDPKILSHYGRQKMLIDKFVKDVNESDPNKMIISCLGPTNILVYSSWLNKKKLITDKQLNKLVSRLIKSYPKRIVTAKTVLNTSPDECFARIQCRGYPGDLAYTLDDLNNIKEIQTYYITLFLMNMHDVLGMHNIKGVTKFEKCVNNLR